MIQETFCHQTYLLVHQSWNLEEVALAMMLEGSTVPDITNPSAIAWAMAPPPTKPILDSNLLILNFLKHLTSNLSNL